MHVLPILGERFVLEVRFFSRICICGVVDSCAVAGAHIRWVAGPRNSIGWIRFVFELYGVGFSSCGWPGGSFQTRTLIIELAIFNISPDFKEHSGPMSLHFVRKQFGFHKAKAQEFVRRRGMSAAGDSVISRSRVRDQNARYAAEGDEPGGHPPQFFVECQESDVRVLGIR